MHTKRIDGMGRKAKDISCVDGVNPFTSSTTSARSYASSWRDGRYGHRLPYSLLRCCISVTAAQFDESGQGKIGLKSSCIKYEGVYRSGEGGEEPA